jgi:hypothetical protein
VPVLGGDITNNTWFTNPLIFPQGSPPQSVGYGYNDVALHRYGKKKLGHIYCAEIPQSCTQIDQATKEAASKVGATIVLSARVSITAPSYQSECIQMQNKGAEVIAMTLDAASQRRFVSDCQKLNYKPLIISHPLGVGYESRFFGQPLLGGSIIPMVVFGWMANSTPAESYWQSSIKRFNPGSPTGTHRPRVGLRSARCRRQRQAGRQADLGPAARGPVRAQVQRPR